LKQHLDSFRDLKDIRLNKIQSQISSEPTSPSKDISSKVSKKAKKTEDSLKKSVDTQSKMLEFMTLPEEDRSDSTRETSLRSSKQYLNWAKKDAKKTVKPQKKDITQSVSNEFELILENGTR
jgi:hypothetical protein